MNKNNDLDFIEVDDFIEKWLEKSNTKNEIIDRWENYIFKDMECD